MTTSEIPSGCRYCKWFAPGLAFGGDYCRKHLWMTTTIDTCQYWEARE